MHRSFFTPYVKYTYIFQNNYTSISNSYFENSLEVCGRFNRGLTYDIYERISYEILDQPHSYRFIDYSGDERMLVYNVFKSITK